MFCVTRKTTHILCKSDKKPSEGESLEPPLPHCHRSITAQKLPYISLKFGLRLPVLPSSAPPGHLPPGEGRVGTEKPPAPKRGAGGDDGVLVQHLAPAQAAHVGLADSSPMSTLALDCSRARSNSAWVTPCSVGSRITAKMVLQRLSLGLPPQGGVDAEVAGYCHGRCRKSRWSSKAPSAPAPAETQSQPRRTVDITWSALQYRLDESVGYPKIG